jgi:hypothetical protein
MLWFAGALVPANSDLGRAFSQFANLMMDRPGDAQRDAKRSMVEFFAPFAQGRACCGRANVFGQVGRRPAARWAALSGGSA